MNFQLLNLYPEPPLKFFQAKFINFTLTNTYNARVLFRVAHLLNILEVVNSSANYQIIPTKGLLQPSESKAIKIIPHQLHSQGEIVLEAIEYSD
jgi:hypothetical protein